MLKGMICVSLGFLLCGCAAPQPQQKPQANISYSRQDTSQNQFMQDRYECIKDAQQRRDYSGVSGYGSAIGGSSSSTVITSKAIFTGCMGARGYEIRTDGSGNLSAPPGAMIQLQ